MCVLLFPLFVEYRPYLGQNGRYLELIADELLAMYGEDITRKLVASPVG